MGGASRCGQLEGLVGVVIGCGPDPKRDVTSSP